jgi:hypothetical protein
MKRLTVAWLSAFLLSGSALTSYAQTNSPIPERDSSSVSLFEYATKIPKRNKVFNLDSTRTFSRGSWMKPPFVSGMSKLMLPER